MITTALAHAHATLHVHPEAVVLAAVSLGVSLLVWKLVSGLRRGKARG